MSNQIAFLIFELKGMIDAIDHMSTVDEQLDHPCIEALRTKINELAELIKE